MDRSDTKDRPRDQPAYPPATPVSQRDPLAYDRNSKVISETQPMLEQDSPDLRRVGHKPSRSSSDQGINLDYHGMTYTRGREPRQTCSVGVWFMGTLVVIGLVTIGAITASMAAESYDDQSDELTRLTSSMNAHYTAVPEHNGSYSVWVSQRSPGGDSRTPYLSVNIDSSGDDEGYKSLGDHHLSVTYILLSYGRDEAKFPSVKIDGDQVYSWLAGSPIKVERHFADDNATMSVIGDPLSREGYAVSARCTDETSVTLSVLGSGFKKYSLLSITSFYDIWNDITVTGN